MSPRSIRRAHARRIAHAHRQALLRRRRELAAGVVGAALLMPGAAQAHDFLVTQSSDAAPDGLCDSSCTLRDATALSNTNSEDDVITFAPAVTSPITLTQGELPIGESGHTLSITGPGRDALTISGNDASRIFNIASDSGAVTVGGLTLAHGSTSGGGGAILDANAPLTIAGTAITNSHADSGGAISTGGKLTLSASTISGNTANQAGGVYAGSSSDPGFTAKHTITDTTFDDNHATSGSAGGLAVAFGKMTITDSTFTANTATQRGGAFSGFTKYGLSISGSTVSGNTAASGGGLDLESPIKYAPIRVTESTVSGNQATHGAGIYVTGVNGGNAVTIARSTVSGNSGADNSFGGGILFDKYIAGNAKVVDSTVTGNTASSGGGISIGSDIDLPTQHKYRSDGNTGTIAFDNSTISGNTATAHGGGIYLSQYTYGSPPSQQSASATITSTIVAGNTAGGTAQDLDRVDTSTSGGFSSAFSLIQAPGDAPLTQQQTVTGVDPQLGALADNGGPTKTMLPAGTSPVIDQGRAPAQLDVDQRNLARVVDTGIANPPNGGDGTDIGAVELAADQVVLPPPPPKATFGVSVRGKSISPGTPLVPASLLPFDCAVTVVSMSECKIELRSLKSTKLSRTSSVPQGSLLAEGIATSSAGATNLSLKVKLTRDGKAVMKALPVGVDTLVEGAAATGTTDSMTQKGAVHLLAGPSVTLGLGKRTTKLPRTTQQRLDQLAKLIPDAKTVTCAAYSDKGKGDVALTKKQAKAACDRLVKDGIKAKVTSSGKGHAKPVASNKTKKGRALNRRITITFTL